MIEKYEFGHNTFFLDQSRGKQNEYTELDINTWVLKRYCSWLVVVAQL